MELLYWFIASNQGVPTCIASIYAATTTHSSDTFPSLLPSLPLLGPLLSSQGQLPNSRPDVRLRAHSSAQQGVVHRRQAQQGQRGEAGPARPVNHGAAASYSYFGILNTVREGRATDGGSASPMARGVPERSLAGRLDAWDGGDAARPARVSARHPPFGTGPAPSPRPALVRSPTNVRRVRAAAPPPPRKAEPAASVVTARPQWKGEAVVSGGEGHGDVRRRELRGAVAPRKARQHRCHHCLLADSDHSVTSIRLSTRHERTRLSAVPCDTRVPRDLDSPRR
ncbi:hypothetical protein E2C01_024189 [Portunus trituberculatus]|uniref:Uncharacterized protein n=1 Tax=Portunus trituberculatus TaxID=210409 RepID=A0A5B7ECH4_PORTR|nr:hypothetical protein [Portunus trituberculatus]